MEYAENEIKELKDRIYELVSAQQAASQAKMLAIDL